MAVVASALVLESSVPAAPARAASPFVVLQMNLCGSGMAKGCYSFGRAVDEAVTKIRRYPPELVTLQEVCYGDVYGRDGWGKLASAMANLYGRGNVVADFMPANNRYTHQAYRCLNGEPYGVALIHRYNGRETHHGWYRSQDPSDEIRAWTCDTVIEGRLTACTTHLSTDPDVAVRQCRELMSTLSSRWVMPEVIVAGDFNLRLDPGGPHGVAGCTAGDYDIRSDGAIQQVVFSQDILWVRGIRESMRWTDHPLLYEQFRV